MYKHCSRDRGSLALQLPLTIAFMIESSSGSQTPSRGQRGARRCRVFMQDVLQESKSLFSLSARCVFFLFPLPAPLSTFLLPVLSTRDVIKLKLQLRGKWYFHFNNHGKLVSAADDFTSFVSLEREIYWPNLFSFLTKFPRSLESNSVPLAAW